MVRLRVHSLENLNARVIGCTACPRLRAHCTEVARTKRRAFRDQEYWGRPVPAFGDPDARLIIIGLAPAAHGANRTGRMFTGDSSGDWLYAALYRSGFASQPNSTGRDDGMSLIDCYVTAAARCAPPGNRPTADELRTCQGYLQRELELLRKANTFLTLGRIAHDQWLKASGWWDVLPPCERPPFGHGSVTRLPDGTAVIASYHPSRQNTNTGRLTRPMWHTVFQTASTLAGRSP